MARGVMCLDGDYHREFPQNEAFAYRSGDTWYVVKRGPSYINQYQVTSFDDAGLAWLRAHDRTEAAQ